MEGKVMREGAIPSHPSAISHLQWLETYAVLIDLWLNQYLDSTLSVPDRH